MYVHRVKNYSKRGPVKRWNLPDRTFFACGACHILAYAFLEAYGEAGMEPLWIRPHEGFTGNHIIAATDRMVFDFHGYSQRDTFVERYFRRARVHSPGWDGALIALPVDVLISTEKSRRYDGLWLRQPDLFLHDPLPRARAFLKRFDPPSACRADVR